MKHNIWSSIDLLPLEDKETTGNFEVRILDTDELIHSKKRGLGRAESQQEKQNILSKIEDALDKL